MREFFFFLFDGSLPAGKGGLDSLRAPESKVGSRLTVPADFVASRDVLPAPIALQVQLRLEQ